MTNVHPSSLEAWGGHEGRSAASRRSSSAARANDRTRAGELSGVFFAAVGAVALVAIPLSFGIGDPALRQLTLALSILALAVAASRGAASSTRITVRELRRPTGSPTPSPEPASTTGETPLDETLS